MTPRPAHAQVGRHGAARVRVEHGVRFLSNWARHARSEGRDDLHTEAGGACDNRTRAPSGRYSIDLLSGARRANSRGTPFFFVCPRHGTVARDLHGRYLTRPPSAARAPRSRARPHLDAARRPIGRVSCRQWRTALWQAATIDGLHGQNQPNIGLGLELFPEAGLGIGRRRGF